MKMTSVNQIGRCDVMIDALRTKLGAIVAERILNTEAADFLSDSRVRERYLGEHIDAILSDQMDPQEVATIAILSVLNGRWHAGICLVNGEGAALELLWKSTFGSREEAEIAFALTRPIRRQ